MAFGLFAVLVAIYALSPVKTSFDSRWSVHTAASLLRGDLGALDAYAPLLRVNDHYAIETCKGRPRNVFPVGVSVLAIPGLLIAEAMDPDLQETLRHHIPSTLEKLIASFYGALAIGLFFLVVQSRFASLSIAAATAVVFGLGTSMWSVATRALWQHGPVILMLVVAMLLLERARTRPALAQLIGLPLAAAVVIRPTAAVPAVVLGLWLLICDRRAFLGFAAWSAVVLVPWVAYNLATCGTIYPAYYDPFRISGGGTGLQAAFGNLFSPGRGLLVYSPVLVFALAGFVVAVRTAGARGLAVAYGLIVALHWIAVSRFPHWWGGHSYGARLMSDVLPFLFWFVAFALAAIDRLRGKAYGILVGAFVVLSAVSVAVQTRGSLSFAGYAWNITPIDIDRSPERLWDWRHPPFLHGLH